MVVASTWSFAQPGMLDSSFANAGILVSDISGGPEVPNDILVQPDGKILVAMSADFDPMTLNSDFVVVRFEEDGSVDTSFGDNGMYQFDNTLGSDIPYKIELLDDGSILVIGAYFDAPAQSDFMVIKLDADGIPDPAFGTDGVSINSVDGGLDYARAGVVQEDGKIVLAGFSNVPNFSPRRNVVMRLMPDGALDTLFGNQGIFMWQDDGTSNELYAAALAPDGGILTAGFFSPDPAVEDQIVLYKLQEDGQGLDTLFGDKGQVLSAIDGIAYSMEVHPNGNILVAGHALDSIEGSDFIVLAYNQDGMLNESFGVNGVFQGHADLWDFGFDLAIQPDGKILITGESGPGFFGPPRRFTTVRCFAGGLIDPSWGVNGISKTFTSTVFAFAISLAIQPTDGKVVVAGVSQTPSGNDLTLVRYHNFIDVDMDGYSMGSDCDDNNMDINPGAMEIPYNGIDEDCNPLTPDDDLDGDGFLAADDCDDLNENINPGLPETPYNYIDDDCNPMTPDDDLDGDGFVLADDCDDTNENVNPDGTEIPYNGHDDDCDPLTLDDDLDGDGFVLADDCDDTNENINPDEQETPYNDIDDDCNPLTPDDDLDGDGFVLADDCDDMNADINPDEVETPYNSLDDDCNPLTPDDDLDGDGFVLADDCDDMNADINPDALDIPNNNIDEDCDGMDATSAVSELNANAGVRVYPNPASEYVLIAPDEELPVVAAVGVYSSTGKLLRNVTGPIKDAQIRIAISDLPSGLLIVCVTTEKGVISRRVVKN